MRKTRLIDCNPNWGIDSDERLFERYITFECPEGHIGCTHVIPFIPARDGTPMSSPQDNGCVWQRSGDTFETLTLTPSIQRNPKYPDRESAIAAGCLEQYFTDSMFCALHINIKDGQIEFCSDSK